jgi:hypothetical protein
VLFAHDIEHSLVCVVDLVNTGSTASGQERLGDLQDLQSFVRRHEVSEVGGVARTNPPPLPGLRPPRGTQRDEMCQGHTAVDGVPDCDQVLVDLSRNRSERYCDARTCGNRVHVAAYRARRRAGTS